MQFCPTPHLDLHEPVRRGSFGDSGETVEQSIAVHLYNEVDNVMDEDTSMEKDAIQASTIRTIASTTCSNIALYGVVRDRSEARTKIAGSILHDQAANMSEAESSLSISQS